MIKNLSIFVQHTGCPEHCYVAKPLGCKTQKAPFVVGEKPPFRTDPRCDEAFEGIGLQGVDVSPNCKCKKGFVRDDSIDLQAVLNKNFGTGMCLKLDECKEGCDVAENGKIIGVRHIFDKIFVVIFNPFHIEKICPVNSEPYITTRHNVLYQSRL